ncbi:MAG: hypothetical protein FJ040_13235, partial [Chloroflexi bacterium]|nr:hypothetical protein [Chloroflexota bacterium]
MNLAKTWNSVLGSLELTLPRIEYNTWLRRSELVHLDTQTAVVSVATHMLREAVETRYAAMIADQLKDILGHSLRVQIVVGSYTPPAPPTPPVVEPVVAPPPAQSSAATSVLPVITDEMVEAMHAELARQAADADDDGGGTASDATNMTDDITSADEVSTPAPSAS